LKPINKREKSVTFDKVDQNLNRQIWNWFSDDYPTLENRT